ncbi:cupin domain-containing protein [Variovorax sp. Sphag1AA]|uniref:cupin domain-containing protein n=1 Tax=Variovorax sp. Sphag1AA TaxID=2587027 RepID=UPI00162090BE|nr:cupin domain-containing protein [Variovorax sp. Sphag1AA]MBB3180925.1 mannose-6-phosphate isomerase-like protein (cupin superfamily) [Variovorax sp. Sphag1AA]
MNNLADLPSDAAKLRFSMRNLPLLEGGATMDLLGLAPALWAHSKVYSTGGENALHSHDIEDHVFLILQGEATFHFGDGSTTDVRAFEGVTVPRGTRYRFHANEAGGNLVMFRVGAALVKDSSDLDPKFAIPREALQSRSDSQGQYAAGDAKKNGVASQPTVFKPGAFFAAD